MAGSFAYLIDLLSLLILLVVLFVLGDGKHRNARTRQSMHTIFISSLLLGMGKSCDIYAGYNNNKRMQEEKKHLNLPGIQLGPFSWLTIMSPWLRSVAYSNRSLFFVFLRALFFLTGKRLLALFMGYK